MYQDNFRDIVTANIKVKGVNEIITIKMDVIDWMRFNNKKFSYLLIPGYGYVDASLIQNLPPLDPRPQNMLLCKQVNT